MNRLLLLMSIPLAVMVFVAGPGFAGTPKLPVTGQTYCYDENGTVISCKGTGQDGDTQAGVAWPDPRFTENGDGTVTDNLTGLTWLQDGNCLGGMDWELAVTEMDEVMKTLHVSVADAEDKGEEPFCLGLKKGSSVFSETWRVPTVNELESLFGYHMLTGKNLMDTLELEAGIVDLEDSYLTNTSYPGDDGGIFYYLPFTGEIMNGGQYSMNLLPVYGKGSGPAPPFATGQKKESFPGDGALNGVAWPDPRFKDNKDGTVTDNMTGLMWLQDMLCFSSLTWQEGLDAVNKFNAGPGGKGFYCGNYTAFHTDWRMPNIKELLSLMDRSSWGPPLPSDHPFLFNPGAYFGSPKFDARYYWSSTTAFDQVRAHTIDNIKGLLEERMKTDNLFVLPVRTATPASDAESNKLLVDPAYNDFGDGTFLISAPSTGTPIISDPQLSLSESKTLGSSSVTLTNNSSEKLKIDKVEISPGQGTTDTDFSITSNECKGKTLEPSEKCGVAVKFTPGSEGEKEGNLHIVAVEDSPIASVETEYFMGLSGKGVAHQTYTVSVSKSGSLAGQAVVTSADGGISCGEDCSESYPEGSSIYLSGPFTTSDNAWFGPCYQVGTSCRIESLENNVHIVANFEDPSGDGSGTTPGSDPVPDIKANGSDTQIKVDGNTPVSITISLDSGNKGGINGDWWLWAEALHNGSVYNLYYDAVSSQWLTGQGVSVQGGLADINGFEILKIVLPPGDYYFHFGVDTEMNGEMNATFHSDSVLVTVGKLNG